MLKQTNINIMHSGIVNKIRYDDLGKPMKQTSFTVKNLGENLPEKQFTIEKRSFKSSTKPLSLDSTISVDKLTEETFYHFRTFELFNILTPPFCPDPCTFYHIFSPFFYDWQRVHEALKLHSRNIKMIKGAQGIHIDAWM